MPYVLGGLAAILVGVVGRIIHLISKHNKRESDYQKNTGE